MNFNILGIGLPQIAIVLILSLVLFGPKQMIQYAYQAGRFLSKARAMWEEAARSMQQEMQNSGVDLQEFRDLGQGLQQDWNKAVNGTLNDLNNVTNVNSASSVNSMASGTIHTVGENGSDIPGLTAVLPFAPATPIAPADPPAASVPAATNPPAAPSLDLSDVEGHGSASDDSDPSKKYDAWLLN